MDDVQRFWSVQTSSLHRSSDDSFYRRKAVEHAAFIREEDREAGCVDLGCGAGELLLHLARFAKVDAGIDYSESMLAQARERLSGLGIELLQADPMEYLATSKHRAWITTGAINQYYSAEQMESLLDLFCSHSTARCFYLFDCVDPLRYFTRPFGLAYEPPRTMTALRDRAPWVRRLRRAASRWRTALWLGLGRFDRPVAALRRLEMGFGQRPDFWIASSAQRGLETEIVSSLLYEYRYHVRIGRRNTP